MAGIETMATAAMGATITIVGNIAASLKLEWMSGSMRRNGRAVEPAIELRCGERAPQSLRFPIEHAPKPANSHECDQR